MLMHTSRYNRSSITSWTLLGWTSPALIQPWTSVSCWSPAPWSSIFPVAIFTALSMLRVFHSQLAPLLGCWWSPSTPRCLYRWEVALTYLSIHQCWKHFHSTKWSICFKRRSPPAECQGLLLLWWPGFSPPPWFSPSDHSSSAARMIISQLASQYPVPPISGTGAVRLKCASSPAECA